MAFILELPDMMNRTYAMRVPGSLFNRRYLQVRYGDALWDAEKVTFTYKGITPECVAGKNNLPGISIEKNILYIRPEAAEINAVDIEIEITAEVVINGTTYRDARPALILNAGYKDFPAPVLSDTPLGQAEGDWRLYFHDEFSGDDTDALVWSPYYLRCWEGENPGSSRSRREMVTDESGNGYLVLTSNHDMKAAIGPDGDTGHRVSAVSSFEKQHLHLMGPKRKYYDNYTIPTFDGGAVNTRYGYFEVRMRMPNSGDGSHFAWWMVGTQDDAHPSARYAGVQPKDYFVLPDNGFRFPEDGRPFGELDSYFTNYGTEYDIVESSLDVTSPNPSSPYNMWLPVIHSNGSRHRARRWFAGRDVYNQSVPDAPFGWYDFNKHKDGDYPNGRDGYQEFHVYGFEWDENGTKFYVDGDLVYKTPATTHFRMMHFLSMYAGMVKFNPNAYGNDYGYWPKETFIDYIRIWKRNRPAYAQEVVLNGDYNRGWDYFRVPETGVSEITLTAEVRDNFGKPYVLQKGENLRWRFSTHVGGNEPLYPYEPRTEGEGVNPVPAWWNVENVTPGRIYNITLDAETGILRIPADAPLAVDLFITAYVDGAQYPYACATKHVQLSNAPPAPTHVVFNNPPQQIAPGGEITLMATVLDQYQHPMPDEKLIYALTRDIAGNTPAAPPGITLTESTLTVGKDAIPGSFFIVSAHLVGGNPRSHYRSLPIQVIVGCD